MRNNIQKISQSILTIIIFLGSYNYAIAGPPPPPGVPIDGGVSILAAAAIGYGAYKMRKRKEEL